jgi:hypothetical protein
MYFVIKLVVSAAIVAAVSEIAKRSTMFGALVASLPLTSLLALIWLYRETGDANRVAMLSSDILWLVLPSLVLFALLPILLKRGMNFYPALSVAGVATIVAYALVSTIMRRWPTYF